MIMKRFSTEQAGTMESFNSTIFSEKNVNNSLIFTYSLSFLIFASPSLDIVIGPILAILFAYFLVARKGHLVFPLMIVANDGLGSILLGRVQFYWILFVFAGVEVLFQLSETKRINKRLITRLVRLLVLLLIGIIFAFQPYYAGGVDISESVKLFSYIAYPIVLVNRINEKNLRQSIFTNFSISIWLLALHALIFGGVENSTIGREGIIGVGTGNSNIAAIVLALGVVFTIFSEYRLAMKVVITATIIIMLFRTGSITGVVMVATSFLLIGFTRIKPTFSSILSLIVFALFAFIIINFIYSTSTTGITIVDFILLRIREKTIALYYGDYNNFSTYRYEILLSYWNYYISQPVNKILLGGNHSYIPSISLYVSHNTVMDWLLRFGILGIFIVAITITVRLIRTKSRNPYFLLLINLLIASVSVSLNSGISAALLFILLVII